MIKLYTIPESLYCAKTRILLRYKNLEWKEFLPPGGYGSDEYKTYIPSGNLPALVEDNFTLADSECIAEYLEDIQPDPSCLPTDPRYRAKAREISRFHDTRLEPCLRQLFCIFDDIRLSEAEIQTIAGQIQSRIMQLDEMLSGYLAIKPENLTLADCGFPITFLWIEKLSPYFSMEIQVPVQIEKYLNHLQTIPAVQKELANYGPILDKFLNQELRRS